MGVQQQMFDEDPQWARFATMARAFPSLIDWVPSQREDWDAESFAAANAGRSGGEKDAALFVLSVWNSTTDWADYGLQRAGSGRFDLHAALSNWDAEHHAAFLAWARAPFWM